MLETPKKYFSTVAWKVLKVLETRCSQFLPFSSELWLAWTTFTSGEWLSTIQTTITPTKEDSFWILVPVTVSEGMQTCELIDYFPRALRYFFVGAQVAWKCGKYEKKIIIIFEARTKKRWQEITIEGRSKLGQRTWERQCKKIEDGEDTVINKQEDGLWTLLYKFNGIMPCWGTILHLLVSVTASMLGEAVKQI